MTKPRRSPNRAIIAAAAAGALLIGGAVVALADPPTTPILGGPTGFVTTTAPTFTITDGDGGTLGSGTFLWGLDEAPATGPVAAGNLPLTSVSQGAHELRVKEIGTPPDDDSPIATRSFFVDSVKPNFSRSLSVGSPNGTNGWYRSTPSPLTVTYSCSDPGAPTTGSGLATACPQPLSLSGPADDGVYVLATGISDNAGNAADPDPALTIKRDSTVPDNPNPTGPIGIANTLTPVFTWKSVDDVNPGVAQISGFLHYVITVRTGSVVGSGTQVDQATLTQQPLEVTYPSVVALTNGSTYNWTVQAVDNAGNVNTDGAAFTVDINAPDDPTFSAGPVNGAATNDNTPSFTFAGVPGATFTWETRNGLGELVTGAGFAGTGAQTTVTLPTLADGNYTFKVKQQAPNLKESGFASALFTVDTTAPAAPTINSSPGTTTNAQPSFGWSAAEQDGTFVWEVTGVGGIRVQGPGEAATAAVSLPSPLGAGNYAFRVRQRDRAGNLSDWSAGEPFTIVNPVDPGPGPGPGGGTSGFRPSTRNAKALLPRVGVKVKPAATTLRWKKTRGATLYNLQVFRIDGTTYRKVHSAFPRGLKYKVPKKVLKSGRRYVWRVWPYLGKKKKYTPAPFGISWFDAK